MIGLLPLREGIGLLRLIGALIVFVGLLRHGRLARLGRIGLPLLRGIRLRLLGRTRLSLRGVGLSLRGDRVAPGAEQAAHRAAARRVTHLLL